MKTKQTIVMAATLAAAVAPADAQQSTTVVVGQPAAGRTTSGRTSVVLGMPAPRYRPVRQQPPSTTSDQVPETLGSEIRWHSYTLDGRKTGEGLVRFDERGGRRLLLRADETGGRGPRIIVCQSTQGRSRWRRLLWIP